MKSILLVIFSGINLTLFCQITPVNFNDCKYDMFFVSAETSPGWNNDTLSVPDYFNNYFSANSIKLENTTDGKIILGIIIFEDGKTCCHSFFNVTNKELDPEIFKDAVNSMPDWKPAIQKGKEIIFLNNLVIKVQKGVFTN